MFSAPFCVCVCIPRKQKPPSQRPWVEAQEGGTVFIQPLQVKRFMTDDVLALLCVHDLKLNNTVKNIFDNFHSSVLNFTHISGRNPLCPKYVVGDSCPKCVVGIPAQNVWWGFLPKICGGDSCPKCVSHYPEKGTATRKSTAP